MPEPTIDIINIIKELKDSNFSEVELKVGKISLKLKTCNVSSQEKEIQTSEVLPITENIESLDDEENTAILDRCKEQDIDFLEELPFLDPEVAAELEAANIVVLGEDGNYRYQEGA